MYLYLLEQISVQRAQWQQGAVLRGEGTVLRGPRPSALRRGACTADSPCKAKFRVNTEFNILVFLNIIIFFVSFVINNFIYEEKPNHK